MSGPFAEGGYIPPRAARPATAAVPAGWPAASPCGPGVVARHRYPLDNDDRLAVAHHECLSVLLDPFSRMRAAELFEPDGGLDGKRCLDVGAGVGARYARWLAEQVGAHGRVMALDIKPRQVPAHPRLAALVCDLSEDIDQVDDGWDFIHARLTLGHLPARRQILTRLVETLKPGGRILVEDWDASRSDMVLAASSLHAAEQSMLVQDMVGRLFATAGTDRTWARRVHAAMLADGLGEVHTVMHAESWAGGGLGARLLGLTIDELRPALLAAGLAEAQLDQAKRLLGDPRLVLAGHLLHSTSGRKPDRP